MRYIFFLPFVALLFLSSCEDVIDIDYDVPTETIYNFDAFINDGLATQTIRIVESPNFLNSEQPTPVENAEVKVTDVENNTYTFTYAGDGVYEWNPSNGIGLKINDTEEVKLEVTIGSNQYSATSAAGNVPPIDSLTFVLDDSPFAEEGIYNVEFWATDIENEENYYWAKVDVEGRILGDTYSQNKLTLNGAYDASSDGIQFIPPIRSYELLADPGDSVTINLLGLDIETFNYLSESFELLGNGGLFAVPYYNPRCNVKGTDGSSPAIGWFGATKVATMTVLFNPE